LDLSTATSISMSHIKGNINYELSKLPIAIGMGNVLAVVSDRRVPHSSSGVINYYTADIVSSNDYYPGGSIMPGRSFSSNSYRFGYNAGSEKDDEITGVTGSHFTTFFREFDTRILRPWSPDPVFQPWQSPYSYMDGNPILYNDPRGDFSPPIHADITSISAKLNNLTSTQLYWMVAGSKNADYLGFAEDWHFDNRKNIGEIKSSFTEINNRISNRESWDFYGLGADLHNVQDFYAHSNYVELYVQYYQSKGGDMKDFDASSIPSFDEIDSDLEQYLKDNNLRTGEWDNFDNEKMPWTDKDKLSKDTHYRMNKDDKDQSLKGKEKIKGTNITYHDAAKKVAQKHTNKIVKEFKKKSDE